MKQCDQLGALYYSNVWKSIKQLQWCMVWRGWWRKFWLHTGFNKPAWLPFIYLNYLFFSFFNPPALFFSTVSSFPSCKLETKGGGVFAVNRNPASGERWLVVLGWLHVAATMHCLIGGMGTSFSQSVAETGKWDTSQEVKNWASSVSTLLAVFCSIILPNCLPANAVLISDTIFSSNYFPCVYKARLKHFFHLYGSVFCV